MIISLVFFFFLDVSIKTMYVFFLLCIYSISMNYIYDKIYCLLMYMYPTLYISIPV